MLTPLAFIAGLAAFLALPRIHDNPILAASFAAAVVALSAWCAALWRRRLIPPPTGRRSP